MTGLLTSDHSTVIRTDQIYTFISATYLPFPPHKWRVIQHEKLKIWNLISSLFFASLLYTIQYFRLPQGGRERDCCDDLYDCKLGCQDVSNEPIALLSCLVRDLLLTAPCEFHTWKGILLFVSVSERRGLKQKI